MNCSPRWCLLLFSAVSLLAPFVLPATDSGPVTVARINYHGWPDSLLVGNGVVEAVVVPAIGRVMQFRFAGSADGPFWENGTLRGSRHDPASKEWSNFGGDKALPAPQSDWPRRIGRAWPPPAGFDSLPMTVEIDRMGVTLTSQVDPDYGIRVRRRIELTPAQPVMTIVTHYEKVRGPALETAVWTVTQVKDPVAVYAVLPPNRPAGSDYVRQSDEPPPQLAVAGDLLSVARDPARNHKIGLASPTLVWIGGSETLRLDVPKLEGAPYPDANSSAEIYTQADPLAYVELEMLAALKALRPGDGAELTVTYTLGRRTEADPAAEIRSMLRR